MSLKPIPVEKIPSGKRGKKSFQPKVKTSEPQEREANFLKGICLRLIHFINRGGKYTYQQIDELIIGLQRGILNLQKRKNDLLTKKNKKFGEHPISFKKRKIS